MKDAKASPQTVHLVGQGACTPFDSFFVKLRILFCVSLREFFEKFAYFMCCVKGFTETMYRLDDISNSKVHFRFKYLFWVATPDRFPDI